MTAKPAPAIRIIGHSPVTIFGLDGGTRLMRQFASAGFADAAFWPAPIQDAASVVMVRGDYLLEENLLLALAASPGSLLADPVSGQIAGAHIQTVHAGAMAEWMARKAPPDEAGLPEGVSATSLSTEGAGAYSAELKKRITAYLMPITALTQPQIERDLFAAVYKGVTDIITKHVWPWPAFHVTRFCARQGVTPNMVTSVGAVLTLLAYLLFLNGQFGLGLLAAWGMTFLDTVDGKLARVTVTSSFFGNIFDHGIDLIHPPFWYWAWGLGIAAAGGVLWQPSLIFGVVIGGYVLQRLQEGGFTWIFGIAPHVWRPFDSRFRLITARRNPNLILLTLSAIIGRPDLGMLAVALWTLICIGIHFMQIFQAAGVKRRGLAIRSWLAA